MGDAGSSLVMVSAPLAEPVPDGLKVTLTAHDEPADKVVRPHVLETANPGVVTKLKPFTAIALMFRSVSDSVAVLPAATLPKACEVGFTTNSGCVPTPDSATVSGKAVADVATDSVPRSVPAEVGAKTTAMVQLAPAGNAPAAGQGEGAVEDAARAKSAPVTASDFKP